MQLHLLLLRRMGFQRLEFGDARGGRGVVHHLGDDQQGVGGEGQGAPQKKRAKIHDAFGNDPDIVQKESREPVQGVTVTVTIKMLKKRFTKK